MTLEHDLCSLLGSKGWVSAAESEPWRRDWLDRHGELPLGVARPATTDETAGVLALCAAANVPVTPQGGNTNLTGAAVLGGAGGVILSMARMDRIEALDDAGATIQVEAGVVLSRLHSHLEGTGLMFPIHIGAEGSAQIGGLIATNAGGSHAFRFGMMQDLVFGIEAVLPDGQVWNGLRRVQKDNAGYQLRKLFCGSEGTLGVVTRAVLKLSPAPVKRITALLAVTHTAAAIALAARYRAVAGEFLTALEFFSDLGLGMALDTIPGLSFPLERRAPVYMLIEAAAGSEHVPLDAILEEMMERAIQSGDVLDGTVARSESQRQALWRLPEEQPEGQKRSGAQLKHDISVPPGALSEFLERAAVECEKLLSGVQINAFGHLGDGNVHYNLSPPPGQPGFVGKDHELAEALGRLATRMDGSFAAEDGLGRAKIALADRLRDPVERRLMARIKSGFDPGGILNPGVIVAEEENCGFDPP